MKKNTIILFGMCAMISYATYAMESDILDSPPLPGTIIDNLKKRSNTLRSLLKGENSPQKPKRVNSQIFVNRETQSCNENVQDAENNSPRQQKPHRMPSANALGGNSSSLNNSGSFIENLFGRRQRAPSDDSLRIKNNIKEKHEIAPFESKHFFMKQSAYEMLMTFYAYAEQEKNDLHNRFRQEYSRFIGEGLTLLKNRTSIDAIKDFLQKEQQFLECEKEKIYAFATQYEHMQKLLNEHEINNPLLNMRIIETFQKAYHCLITLNNIYKNLQEKNIFGTNHFFSTFAYYPALTLNVLFENSKLHSRTRLIEYTNNNKRDPNKPINTPCTIFDIPNASEKTATKTFNDNLKEAYNSLLYFALVNFLYANDATAFECFNAASPFMHSLHNHKRISYEEFKIYCALGKEIERKGDPAYC